MKIDSEEIFIKYIFPGFLVLILFIATIFIFSNFYWYQSVPINEARHVNAVYSSYEKKVIKQFRGGYDIYIIMEFSDYEELEIESIIFNEQIEDAVKAIEPGTEVSLIIHPYTNAILDMEVDGKKIILYEESQKIRTRDGVGFLVIGIVVYCICAFLLAFMIKKKKKNPRYVRFKR